MKAVILCGGQGTRLRDPRGVLGATGTQELIPKPMLPIGGRPIVWHILRSYYSFGVREFVLCLGYKSWVIKDYFINYSAMNSDVTVRLDGAKDIALHPSSDPVMQSEMLDASVTLVETGELTLTAGRIASIRKYVEKDGLFLMTYGDGLSNIDISALMAYHRSHGKVATVTGVAAPSRFGELMTEGGTVTGFAEKPEHPAGVINGGYFVIDSQRIWKYLEGAEDSPFERTPMSRLVEERQIAMFQHNGFWKCMDTATEYMTLTDLWNSGQAPWKTW
jgi:glucose-1-phosphate cytidylyltransferase